jgi:hypothetical protein
MARQYDKEYRRYLISLNLWIKKTRERIEMLPEIDKLSQLSYDQWYEVFKEEGQVKKPSLPPPPPNN